MKVSLCITVFNEEKHIERLMSSIVTQTKLPDEVIIIDGGSDDKTLSLITNYKLRIKNLQVLVKKGNRPFGRNESIKNATGNIIAITDAGCELDVHWLEEIVKPFIDKKVAVVSGYYAGKPQNTFQACLVPYVLVMPDNINMHHFLPSTRSMAMRKTLWEKIGGFPEKYRWNEDYVFAKSIEKENIPITFAQKAIVAWFPRETVGEGFWMFYAFAKGDAQAGIWRPKVLILVVRVLFSIGFIGYALWVRSSEVLGIIWILLIVYLFWSVWKNYRYVNSIGAIIYLPLWQCISDIAVFCGTSIGFIQKISGII